MAFDRIADTQHASDEVQGLLPGTSLFHGEYRVTRSLNSGGFGNTYLATDSLGREVVLKECFVSAFCVRDGQRVVPRSEAFQPHLQQALQGFLSEARAMARLVHPGIVGIRQVFRENATAYMAIDHVRGQDLLDRIDSGQAELTPRQIVALTRTLVSALIHVHEQRLLHCDIAPDNICLTESLQPVLIDFGAARSLMGGQARPLSTFSMVKDGYSPHELYVTDAPVGPWTDIYSLGATIHHVIRGYAPVDSPTRQAAETAGRADPQRPLAGSVQGFPSGFLDSLDRALAVRPAGRYQTARDWLRVIAEPAPTPRDPVVVRRPSVVLGGERPAVRLGA